MSNIISNYINDPQAMRDPVIIDELVEYMRQDQGVPISINQVHEMLPNIEKYLDGWTGEPYEEANYTDLTGHYPGPVPIENKDIDEQIRVVNQGGQIVVIDNQTYAIRGPTIGEIAEAEAEMFFGIDGLAEWNESQSQDRWYAYQTETDKLLGIKRKRYHVTDTGKLLPSELDPTYKSHYIHVPVRKKLKTKKKKKPDVIYYDSDDVDYPDEVYFK